MGADCWVITSCAGSTRWVACVSCSKGSEQLPSCVLSQSHIEIYYHPVSLIIHTDITLQSLTVTQILPFCVPHSHTQRCNTIQCPSESHRYTTIQCPSQSHRYITIQCPSQSHIKIYYSPVSLTVTHRDITILCPSQSQIYDPPVPLTVTEIWSSCVPHSHTQRYYHPVSLELRAQIYSLKLCPTTHPNLEH